MVVSLDRTYADTEVPIIATSVLEHSMVAGGYCIAEVSQKCTNVFYRLIFN